MVELQIVILAVAGSSPVGHPFAEERAANRTLARAVLNQKGVNDLLSRVDTSVCTKPPGFWQQLLTDHFMEGRADLEKLLAGCEIIAALDDLDLLPAY
jgi:hypothetical protein